MTRRLRVEWRPGQRVTALLRMPPRAGGTGVLLAHGAGAGQRHPFMAGLRERLAASGFVTMTFDYPYVEAGRHAPDRRAVLLDCHGAAAGRLRRYVDRIVLAGKSMGGRMASHLAAEGEPATGLVFYGYPLVPAGRSEPRPTGHLPDVDAPMLFVSGDRDRLAPLPLLERLVAGLPAATLEVVPGADHSFRVPRQTGLELPEVLDRLAAVTAAWSPP